MKRSRMPPPKAPMKRTEFKRKPGYQIPRGGKLRAKAKVSKRRRQMEADQVQFPKGVPFDEVRNYLPANVAEWPEIKRVLDKPARLVVEDGPVQRMRHRPDELAHREFMPTIERLVAVSTFSTPSTWTVDTDRGRTDFILKGEEDIRRLRDGGLLITDNHGMVFRVMDLKALDRGSRRLLDRFL